MFTKFNLITGLIACGILFGVSITLTPSKLIWLSNVGWIFSLGAIGYAGMSLYQYFYEKKQFVNNRRTD